MSQGAGLQILQVAQIMTIDRQKVFRASSSGGMMGQPLGILGPCSNTQKQSLVLGGWLWPPISALMRFEDNFAMLKLSSFFPCKDFLPKQRKIVKDDETWWMMGLPSRPADVSPGRTWKTKAASQRRRLAGPANPVPGVLGAGSGWLGVWDFNLWDIGGLRWYTLIYSLSLWLYSMFNRFEYELFDVV